MSKITEKIFKGVKHYITSPYGKRTPIKTSNGYTSSFHYGTDYGTNGKKLEQYALEEGIVESIGFSQSAGNYLWIKYPRLNVKMCHYHLDSIKVTKNQSVNNNTLIGYTGTTGMSTGIHLHLGVYDLKSGCYVDPEVYAKSYDESCETVSKSIDDLAREVIAGKYGNGLDRKNALGSLYDEVQTRVNEILHNTKIFKPGDKVTLKNTATKYCTGQNIPSFVKGKTYTIKQVGCKSHPHGILLKEIYSWVNKTEVE